MMSARVCSGLANTSSTSSFRIAPSSFAQELTNGSPVATVSFVGVTATGRIRKRSAYAFDIVCVTAARSILSGSMCMQRTPSFAASHSTSQSSVIAG